MMWFQAFEVRETVYKAPWYCQPKNVQLTLLMILIKTRRPLTLSAAGLKDCSIKSIGEVRLISQILYVGLFSFYTVCKICIYTYMLYNQSPLLSLSLFPFLSGQVNKSRVKTLTKLLSYWRIWQLKYQLTIWIQK